MPLTSRLAYAYGHLDVTVVLLATPLDRLTPQLAPSLAPAAQSVTPAGTHPQVLMFGHHSKVRPWFAAAPGHGNYLEWIIATPFLEWTDRRGRVTPWATMSRLYLDSAYYTLLGWFYGYPKKYARMEETASTYRVRTFPGGGPRVEMDWRPTGPVQPWSAYAPSTYLAPLFGQPFIDRVWRFPWLGSRMWFELSSASVQPVHASARILPGCARGFPAMTFEAPPVGDTLPGTFRMSCDWMLSRPYTGASMPADLRLPVPPDCELSLHV